MDEQHRRVAGLRTCLIEGTPAAELMIVFLHGYGMRAADLAPFAHSLAIPGVAYAFPEAPLPASGGGYAWWPIAADRRAAELRPRDLAEASPAGRAQARGLVRDLLAELAAQSAARPVLLAGFSQGGMLACDTVLFERIRVEGLVMMSASRIAIDEWQTRADRLQGLRTFVSHGRTDPDLAFGAGERLEEFLTSSGALVTWVPFAGGHEIPFPVWRQFRNFARDTCRLAAPYEKHRHHGTH